MSGGRKICMTDSVGKALFSVPDGGIGNRRIDIFMEQIVLSGGDRD